jgi:3-deoxy-7-phosphoheptulonate synthase
VNPATENEIPDADPFLGRLENPTAAAAIRGVCGDTMEFDLLIRDDRIEDVRYRTDGCGNTRSCGHAVARRAKGRTVNDALSISAGEIIRSGECQPAKGRHCAILAVTTFHRAIADHLLAPSEPGRPVKPVETENINLAGLSPIVSPRTLKAEFPASPAVLSGVLKARGAIQNILTGADPRLLVVVGPCSIHDPKAALEYAGRLARLAGELANDLLVVMRVYFEKPRTTVGWKGLIYDPHMDGTSDIDSGLRTARRLLLDIASMGVPVGTEMLDPIVPQYIADLVSWAAIGARTTESQTHRQMASGLSMPVGFKNRTDGDVQVAVDAMASARHAHSFLGIDEDGHTAIVRTRGNSDGHLILRGSTSGSNYSLEVIRDASRRMADAGLRPAVMVDCSHGNAGKKFEVEEVVWDAVLRHRQAGDPATIGMLVESHLFEGKQPIPAVRSDLRYGVSVTDECVGWEATEAMLRRASAATRSGAGN